VPVSIKTTTTTERIQLNTEARPAFVYLLRCGDDSLYCGWTYDPPRRLAAHAAGRGARYTRGRGPFEFAALFEFPDERSARSEEVRIKTLPRKEKLALISAADPG